MRRCFVALERDLDAYWRDPRPIVRAIELGPEWEDWLGYLDPEVEWKTVFLARPSAGTASALACGTTSSAGELPGRARGGRGPGRRQRVLRGGFTQGKQSDARMDGHFYNVVTIRDDLVARLEEYTTREEALEAAQLQG